MIIVIIVIITIIIIVIIIFGISWSGFNEVVFAQMHWTTSRVEQKTGQVGA